MKKAKGVAVTLLIVVIFFVFIPKAQGIDFTAIPSPFNLQAGVIYYKNGMNFLFNNNYMLVWQNGSTEEYKFRWDNGWKEVGIIKNILPDYQSCISVKNALHKNNSVSVSSPYSSLSCNVFNNGLVIGAIPSFVLLTKLAVVVPKASFFSLFFIVKNMRVFVRNKVPNMLILFKNPYYKMPIKSSSLWALTVCKQKFTGGDVV